MNATKRPSAVAGLKRGLGADSMSVPKPDISNTNHGANLPARTKPVRVTLDLDQEAYTALNQWLGTVAAEVGAPVSKARALRAMIKAVSLDKSIGLVVVDLLRRENSEQPGRH